VSNQFHNQRNSRASQSRIRRFFALASGTLLVAAIGGFALYSMFSQRSMTAPLSSTHISAPRAPVGLYAASTGAGDVLLSWQPPQSAPVGYRIYRSTGHNGPYTIVGTVNAPDIDTYRDTINLSLGTTYVYTVTAFDRQKESEPAGPVVAVLVAPPTQQATAVVPTPLPTFAPLAPATLAALPARPQGSTPVPPTHVSSPSLSVGTPSSSPLPAIKTSPVGAYPTALPTHRP